MSPVVWVAALFLVGIGVMILEVFVPSGGVLAFVSLAAIIAAIAPAFLELGPGADLVGQAGRTTIDLLPWGTVAIGTETLDGVSEGGPIDAGTEVVVVAAQGAAVVVRPLPREEAGTGPRQDGAKRADEPEKPSSPEAPRLSPTLENFTFESFDAPDA